MDVSAEEQDEAVASVVQDLMVTMGWSEGQASDFVRDRAAAVARNLQGVDSGEGSEPLPPRYFQFCLVEEVQLVVHDSQWDSSWPRCPAHDHPLWVRVTDDPLVWRCPKTGKAVRPVGSLVPSET